MPNEFNVPRRRWGKSELFIPIVPFGTQGFGNNFGPVSDEEACQLIRRSVDIGVNHFDCALCYGDSVRKLGVAIKTGVVQRDELIISGRMCCHQSYTWEGTDYASQGEVDYSAAYTVSNVQKQLELLGIEAFDAMLIHDPRQIEPTIEAGGTLDGLKQLKDEGSIRNVGYGMNPHDFHQKAIDTGDLDVLLTFNDFNLFGQSAANTVIAAAAAQDIGVLNGWSIKRGLLTGIDLSHHNQEDREVQRATKMRSWCIEQGISLLAVALQFCMTDERVHGNPIGSLNIEQLGMNARAVSEPLPEGMLEAFLAQGF